jgi:hypothetical protein
LPQAWTALGCVWIIAASLGPDLRVPGIWVLFRPEDLLTVGMSLLGALTVLLGNGRRRNSFVLIRILVLLAGLTLIGWLGLLLSSPGQGEVETGTFGHSRFQEELKEYARFLKYALVAFSFSHLPYRAWRPMFATLITCCLVMVGIQIFQFLAADVINPWIVSVYTDGTPHGSIDYSGDWAKSYHSFRAGSVMVNPNTMGLYLVLPYFLLLGGLAESVRVTRRGLTERHLHVVVIVAVLTGIYLSQSRTVLIALLFGTCVFALRLSHEKRLRLTRWVPGAIGSLSIPLWFFSSSTGRYTIDGVLAGIFNESLNAKVRLTIEAVDQLGIQIIVGAGPAGAKMVDAELGYIVTWYGICGLLLYSGFYFSIYNLIRRSIASRYQQAAWIGIMISFALCAIGNSVLLNNRLFPVFIVLLSVTCSQGATRQVSFRGVSATPQEHPK